MNGRIRIRIIFVMALIVCAPATIPSNAQVNPSATSSSERWVGVWQGQLEGVPGVTLTLGNDLGEVNGAIVFTVLAAESTAGHAEIAGHEVRILMHPRVEGNSLYFQVKWPGSESEILEMTMVLADDTKGQLRCPKCGGSSPIDMEKLQ